MAGLSGAEVMVKALPTPPARPRMLRVEVNGLLHDWFDVDEMGQFVRSPTFSTTLRENIARYFGVPVNSQAIYDEDGLLTTSADFSRALQRFAPKLYIYDAHEMGPHLRERTSEQLAMIDAEVEQSRRNFKMNGSRPRTPVTPRQQKLRSEQQEGSLADGVYEGNPEVTPVKAAQPEAAQAGAPADAAQALPTALAAAPPATALGAAATGAAAVAVPGGPEVAPLMASASSVETTHIGPAPGPVAEAAPAREAAPAPAKAPLEVPVERVAWPGEAAAAQAQYAAARAAAAALVPDAATSVASSQEPSQAAKPSAVATPQSASLRVPCGSVHNAARVMRPSLSVRAPSAPPNAAAAATAGVPFVIAVAPPPSTHAPTTAGAAFPGLPAGGHWHTQPMPSMQAPVAAPAALAPARGLVGQGAAGEPGHPGLRPNLGRSVSPQPVPMMLVRPMTPPVRVPSQVRIEQGATWHPPAVPSWQQGVGTCPGQQQQLIQMSMVPQAALGSGYAKAAPPPHGPTYSPVARGAPGQPPSQLPPQQLSMPARIVRPTDDAGGGLCKDGSPSPEFVRGAGRFFGFMDQMQKCGNRKPRGGSEEGTRSIRKMQHQAAQGVFDGEVESIWD